MYSQKRFLPHSLGLHSLELELKTQAKTMSIKNTSNEGDSKIFLIKVMEEHIFPCYQARFFTES